MKHPSYVKQKEKQRNIWGGGGGEGGGGGGDRSYKTKESPKYIRLGLWETATMYKFSLSFLCSLCQGCIHSSQREFSNIII